VSQLRHFLYDIGFLPTYQVAIPVISVGNLAAGGTGKTPLVIRLAKTFSSQSVAILLRGYGKDEEYILKKHLPNTPIYVDPDRVKSARLAVEQGAELIILDDGYQHRRLARNANVVILRDRDRLSRCIPAGDLRDPISCLKKTDLIVWERDLHSKVSRVVSLDGLVIPSIRGERVGMFCGIGNPSKFKKTLGEMGALIEAEWILADHEPIGQKRLNAFAKRCKQLNVKHLVCTEKDAVKLPPTPLPILVLEIEIEIVGLEKLMAKIEERLYNHAN
jgi:tetraacyldisaccharide 4'-kinase